MKVYRQILMILSIIGFTTNIFAVDYLDNPQQFKEEQLKNIDTYNSAINEMLQKATEYLKTLNMNPIDEIKIKESTQKQEN